VYAALREKEKAFEALNKAYEQHDIPLSAQCNRLLARDWHSVGLVQTLLDPGEISIDDWRHHGFVGAHYLRNS